MDSYRIEINAVSSDGEKRNYEYIVEAESMVDAFNKFDQTLDAAEIRRFIKNGYYNLSAIERALRAQYHLPVAVVPSVP